jgi:hypothetical protein
MGRMDLKKTIIGCLQETDFKYTDTGLRKKSKISQKH